jgi:hypothetical protein
MVKLIKKYLLETFKERNLIYLFLDMLIAAYQWHKIATHARCTHHWDIHKSLHYKGHHHKH